MPIGATIATEEVSQSCSTIRSCTLPPLAATRCLCGGAGDHQCVAGAELTGSAEQKGDMLLDGFRQLAREYPIWYRKRVVKGC